MQYIQSAKGTLPVDSAAGFSEELGSSEIWKIRLGLDLG